MHACPPPSGSRPAAFTLIELLTVIAIIAVLMALLFPAFQSAKNTAKRADAKTTLMSIVAACKSYQNDYGKFPPVTSASAGSFTSYGDITNGKCKVTNNELFNILRAIDSGVNAAHAMNPRQQKYFDAGKAKGKIGTTGNLRGGFCDGKDDAGTAFTAPQAGQLLDPFGTQYCVIMDSTGNDQIDMTTFYSDVGVLRYSVVAISLGLDARGTSPANSNTLGGKGYLGQYRKPSSSEVPDDVVSWQ